MVVYTLEQRWEILRLYFANHGNVAECVRKLLTDFKRREAPSDSYVCYLVKKNQKAGILIDKTKREKPKTMHTPENIAAVAENVCEAPSFSTIVNLGMTPYKVQLVQALKPIDHPMRFRFAKWACDRLTEDPDFGIKNHLCKRNSF